MRVRVCFCEFGGAAGGVFVEGGVNAAHLGSVGERSAWIALEGRCTQDSGETLPCECSGRRGRGKEIHAIEFEE